MARMDDPPRSAADDYKVLQRAGKRGPTAVGGDAGMQQRKVGTSGLVVSAVGLGCNNFGGRLDLAQTRAVVHRALDLGITLFDTADIYGGGGGSERMLGQIFGARRRDVVLATKFGGAMDEAGRRAGASCRAVMAAVEASLARLNTTWIDLYQLHWPDPATPIEETLRALDDLVRQGKVRHVGSSNMTGPQIIAAHRTARDRGLTGFVTAQNEYSLVNRTAERDAIPAMEACGVGLLPYFPLASGLLTGKYRRDVIPAGTRLATPRPHEAVFRDKADWALVDALEQFAGARGRTLLELAFAWLLSARVTASVIAGATSPAQVEQNARAAGWVLSEEERAEVDGLTGGGRS
jgi:aryl-alcohol dehydrogenase-like predicted oxidoreductase